VTENQPLSLGAVVRLRGQPSRFGCLLEIIERSGRSYARVQFPTGAAKVPADQLELMPMTSETALDHLRRGNIEAPEVLRRHLSHVRLSGRLADMLYSLESTDTQFFAHQFKPVLKVLESPTGHLLIADEVGLGKTIEAGLIWTELAARHRYNRLVVLCPKILCDKWKAELSSKFDLSAQVVDANELREVLSSPAAQKKGFSVVCGIQSVRPKPKEIRKNAPADLLANLIDEIDAFDDRIDLLVVDEAHHLRNPGTQSNAAGRMFSRLARHVVMLSATPINLRNEDLHSLLTLVDPDTFRDPRTLERIIQANAPLIRARDALLRGAPKDDIVELLETAASHTLLLGSKTLARVLQDLDELPTELSKYHRAKFATQVEGINQLANVVNRTRRRDVEEHRVIRDPKAYKAKMTEIEREVYDRATQSILDYATVQGYPTGFLTIMPQRMLASCMPAAVSHWLTDGLNMGVDDALDEDEDQASSTPLRRELCRLARDLPSPEQLEAVDTKFNLFRRVLLEHLASNPGEKVVVFSTFHRTLDYLHRRLLEDGVGTGVLDSRVRERTELLRRFRTEPEFRVLLSSEVGSEGIDLQFATAVVNYDLPWNPMRVEQRIGRIDRLGQRAAKVTILNLMHSGTVDERIWDRLYHRLELCKNALGGFEEVLGFEIKALEKDLFSGRLTEAEQRQRIDQTAQAIENIKEHEERLEGEAASLIAHGDYVMREIRDKRDGHRWISPADIVDYLHLGLRRLHPQSNIYWERASDVLEVKLDAEARHAFEEWGRHRQFDPGPLARSASSLKFRLGNPNPASRTPRMTQAHPLLRYISDKMNEVDLMSACAISIAANSKDCGFQSGIYGGAVQEWIFGRRDPELRLAVKMFDYASGQQLERNVSEAVLRSALETGRPWANVYDELELDDLADKIQEQAISALENAFDKEADNRAMKAQDRLAMQLATLQRGADEDRERIRRAISSAGPRLEAANRKRLELLEERLAQRKLELSSRADPYHEHREVAIFILKLE
jgi:superfamily II DNA or RNA helicase